MRIKLAAVLSSLAALAALAVCAAPAVAVVANTAGGRISYLPLNEASPGSTAAPGGALAPGGATEPSGEPPLLYHGGPVMHEQTAYAIFWVPGGYSLPAGYGAAIESYFENVAADSRRSTNVYSVGAQYTETGGQHATYIDSYGGAVTDTAAYPTSGTCPTYSGVESFTACITDAKLEAEVESVVNAQGWPDGLGAEYYVVLPPHAGSCFETAGGICFDRQFCAYHHYTESAGDIYSNISYSPGDVLGCGVGEYPNGHANGNVDDTLSSLSHEANESITDPHLNAWYDVEGFENGDECRNSSDDYGTPLGGGAGTLFNQSIAGGHYFLQQEWSNHIDDCAQRVTPATPAIADPDPVEGGEAVPFDASSSTPGEASIVDYHWDFGDGGSTSGPTPTHTFAAAGGTFLVTLTLEDAWGLTYSTTREVTVIPHLPPQLSIGAASGVGIDAATLNGSVNPEAHSTTYHFEYGPTTAYGNSTAATAAGSSQETAPVAAGIGGLDPSTTYHYRLVATNAVGPATTADATFTTTAAPASSSSSSPSAPSPSSPRTTPGPKESQQCTVPRLVGKTLPQAKAALTRAGCKLGKVTKPKSKRGRRHPALIVKSSAPRAGAKPASGKVNLRLGPKPKRKKRHHHH